MGEYDHNTLNTHKKLEKKKERKKILKELLKIQHRENQLSYIY